MDIESREDLFTVVELFYKKLFEDKDLQHFFVAFSEPENLKKHLMVLVDFWDGILFHSGAYTKNAMQPHIEKNKDIPFEALHFEKWMYLLSAAIDERFEGLNAEVMKSRAQSIATVMQIRILHTSNN
jgi:hemoglobin